MADRFPMTPKGLQRLKEELKHLREVERPKNVRDIEEARAHGDLRENAEYHAAKERQGFIEGRSRELEGMIALAEVIDPAAMGGDRIVFGATVTLEDTDSGEKITYSLVGEHESDIKVGRVSITAPIARAMVGRQVGDTVNLRSARGAREYQVLEIRFEALD